MTPEQRASAAARATELINAIKGFVARSLSVHDKDMKLHIANSLTTYVAPLQAKILRLENDVATLEALLAELERRHGGDRSSSEGAQSRLRSIR
jgi:hypothetical protein